MKAKLLLLFGVLVSVMACQSEQKVAEKFILKTNSGINNLESLNRIKNVIQINKNEFKITIADNSFSKEKSIENDVQSYIEPQKVLIKAEIDKLFDPDNKFCELPQKVTKTLNRLKSEGKSWAPEYVTNFARNLPDTALFLPRTSISVLLHYLMIKSKDGKTSNFTLFGAPTFKKLDIDRFVIKEGFNSFFYSLDCSGFLNAAIEGSGAIPGSDIKASAKSALERKKSMFIAGGVIVSPIAAAFYGNVLGTDLDTLERIMILKELTSIPNVAESDSIIVSVSYEAIWMSNEGSSSFNGEANFQGSTKLGIGVASISASSEAGGKLSRSSSFSSYKTYFTNRKVISELKPFTILEVKEKIKSLNHS